MCIRDRYTAYAAKHHFDEIQYLDIVDCNAGDHHKAFATNFNQMCIRDRYYSANPARSIHGDTDR